MDDSLLKCKVFSQVIESYCNKHKMDKIHITLGLHALQLIAVGPHFIHFIGPLPLITRQNEAYDCVYLKWWNNDGFNPASNYIACLPNHTVYAGQTVDTKSRERGARDMESGYDYHICILERVDLITRDAGESALIFILKTCFKE